MARINIICEGPTEVKFVKEILGSHLYMHHGHICSPFDLGGNPKYERIEHYAVKWIKSEPDAWFTTLIDYYGLKSTFPGFSENPDLPYLEKARRLEAAFGERICGKLDFTPKLIPYFQMHEFEGLLFSDCRILWDWLKLYRPTLTLAAVEKHMENVESPEEINQKKETSPSHRIRAMVPEYDKVVDGKLILEAITLEKVEAACPYFRTWFQKLKSIQ